MPRKYETRKLSVTQWDHVLTVLKADCEVMERKLQELTPGTRYHDLVLLALKGQRDIIKDLEAQE